MPTKEDLQNQLVELLRKHLNKSSFTPADRIPINGGLPLSIPTIRIEAWFYPDVATETSWALAVETALLLQRTPVLAHKRDEGWCFRVPLYMVNPDFELTLSVERHHDFEHTVEMSVKAFALALREYQENVATRDGFIQKINAEARGVQP